MTTGIIVHQIPGRLRMRIPTRRGNAAYFLALQDRLQQIQGVTSCEGNSVTASVVVNYEGETKQLLQQMQEQIPQLAIELNPRVKTGTASGMRPIRLVSGRALTPMFMLGSAMAVVGLIQAMRGKVAVPSITAFWYALDAFRQSGKTG